LTDAEKWSLRDKALWSQSGDLFAAVERILADRLATDTAATACTCTDPALACASCLANRDRNGWPKNWQEALRTPVCPACGKAGVVVGLDSVLLETVPAVRTHACGVGGPGASSDL
jgi:hypothetical protein